MRLSAFAGTWAIERDIDDLRAGAAGRFTGRAEFLAVPGGLAYRETGTLVMSGTPMTATRAYHWREAGGRIEVNFEDGRPFHSFPAEESEAEAIHDCFPDTYRVRYDFAAWPVWTTEWRVRGPRKDYLSVSRFTRPASPTPG